MSECKFIRKNGASYEYGYIDIVDRNTPKEKRQHVVVGKADTMDDALRVNAMAKEGRSKIRPNIEPKYWD